MLAVYRFRSTFDTLVANLTVTLCDNGSIMGAHRQAGEPGICDNVCVARAHHGKLVTSHLCYWVNWVFIHNIARSKIFQYNKMFGLIQLLPSACIMLPSLEWVRVIVNSLSALIPLSQLTADTKHVSQKILRMSLL